MTSNDPIHIIFGFLKCLDNVPIKSKLQHPQGKPRAFELLKIGLFKFPPLGPKWYSNSSRICPTNAPPKERSLSAPVVEYSVTLNQNGKLF